MSRFVILFLTFLLTSALLPSCGDNSEPVPTPEPEPDYFPTTDGTSWATTSPDELDWDGEALDELYDFLEAGNTRAFIVLHEGRIVAERYWGRNFQNTGPYGAESQWYWASAAKSLTATLVGIAQREGDLDINAPTSDYLGTGWTSLTPQRELAITPWHQLTMTTGLDYRVSDLNCTEPACLRYRAAPGTQWFYHNAPYRMLSAVVEEASGLDYNAYTRAKLGNRIGMGGSWLTADRNATLYFSTARDMARFGLLILREGTWDGTPILDDADYFRAMTTPSQELNPAYGYLWWLNGQSAAIYPGTTIAFPTQLAPNAPADLIAAMGKDGQFIDVVPSLDLVVVRQGEAPGDDLVPAQFHDEMWARIGAVIGE